MIASIMGVIAVVVAIMGMILLELGVIIFMDIMTKLAYEKIYIKRENKRRKKMKLLKWIYNNDRLYFTLVGIVVVVSVMISITW